MSPVEEGRKAMIKQALAAILFCMAFPAAAQTRSDPDLTSKLVVAPPSLPGQSQDGDAVICRPPQELPGKRLYGPKVCKSQRQWDDLHRQGLDIGPDGESVVASEKFRTYRCGPAVAC